MMVVGLGDYFDCSVSRNYCTIGMCSIMVLCHVPLCRSSRWFRFPGAGRRPRRQARDTMADRWSYASNASWVPGENIPALHAGGVNGGHSLNAAGMQLFGNCVSNLERLPMKTLKELYSTLTGNITAPCVDAISVAAVLGGVHRKTARQWYASLNVKGVVGSIYTGKIPHQVQVSRWQFRDRVSRWQPRDRLNRIARYIASGR